MSPCDKNMVLAEIGEGNLAKKYTRSVVTGDRVTDAGHWEP